MPTYRYVVEVECDTAEQAAVVMANRIYFDEEVETEDGTPIEYSIWIAERPAEVS